MNKFTAQKLRELAYKGTIGFLLIFMVVWTVYGSLYVHPFCAFAFVLEGFLILLFISEIKEI